MSRESNFIKFYRTISVVSPFILVTWWKRFILILTCHESYQWEKRKCNINLLFILMLLQRRMACNHGILLPNKSSCLCNPGWDSLVLPDQEILNRRLQMCNKGRKGYWKHVLVGVVSFNSRYGDHFLFWWFGETKIDWLVQKLNYHCLYKDKEMCNIC